MFSLNLGLNRVVCFILNAFFHSDSLRHTGIGVGVRAEVGQTEWLSVRKQNDTQLNQILEKISTRIFFLLCPSSENIS